MTDDEGGRDKSKEEKSQELGTLMSKFKEFLNRGQNEKAEPKIKKKQTSIVTNTEEASPTSKKAPTSLADLIA